MKSQATRIPTVGMQTRPAPQPEANADTVPARRHYSDLVSVMVASAIIVTAGVVMAYAGLGLAVRPG